MNVVDSSAWLSYFAGDGNSGKFAKAIETLDELLVPTITITEVFKTICNYSGIQFFGNILIYKRSFNNLNTHSPTVTIRFSLNIIQLNIKSTDR